MIIRGDARNLPLADASVDLIVTSPPFYALRSYTDGGVHYDGQIGAEPTPAEYIDNLIACTREWMRVLKPSGSLWLNLGDKYNGSPSGPRTTGPAEGRQFSAEFSQRKARTATTTPQKSLLGLPWRYALRCIDEVGLILRAEVIWSKPNGLPESVTDRVRRSHEQWFHFVQQPRYYSAVDRIREPHAGEFLSSGVRNPRFGRPGGLLPWEIRGDDRPAVRRGDVDRNEMQGMKAPRPSHALGALPGSVWTIPTQPLKVPEHLGIDHFAAFPMEWPRRIIQGWSPEGICTGCGEGRRPGVDRTEKAHLRPSAYDHEADRWAHNATGSPRKTWANVATVHRITGEVCACPDTSAPTRPAVVLDPFSGTGTTALVAHALGRIAIGVDMSADYCRLATWRVNDPGQRAAALEVDKPPVEVAGQDDLLTLLGGAS
jgi:DNA modification methylase